MCDRLEGGGGPFKSEKPLLVIATGFLILNGATVGGEYLEGILEEMNFKMNQFLCILVIRSLISK